MKALTYDEAFENCMKMWEDLPEEEPESIDDWKDEWLEENNVGDLAYDCYFCEYARQQGDFPTHNCPHCPAKKIDPDFYCCDNEYNYFYHPHKFLAKIRELYVIWKAKDGKVG